MDKDFTTFERQIEILKERNLQFVSEEMAIKALQRFGYYNIINGYKDPYTEIFDGKEIYKNGITFEQIYSLYQLDREIRNYLMASMLEVEDNLRNAVAHTIGEAFTADQTIYLDRKNYRSGKAHNGAFQIDDILNKFNKITNDNVQPMKHYRETYNNIPPWILLKGASFGNIVNFIKLQKRPQKEAIISLIYNIPIGFVSENLPFKDLFMDTLFLCLDYRNRAAHGGRIYNFETKAVIRYNPVLHTSMGITPADYRNGRGATGLTVLSRTLSLFNNTGPFSRLKFACEHFMNRHCELYPQDREYLEKYLTYKR